MNRPYRTRKSFWFPLVAALVLSLLLATAAAIGAFAQDLTLELDPAQTAIRFTLGDVLHTVNGTFKLKSGIIHFNPATGKASGLVTVDVTSGNTGSNARDRKMHEEILESAKYPEATFTPTRVSGPAAFTDQATFDVTGLFKLHGADHEVTLTFPITRSGDTLTTHTHMVLPYVAWGLKNPSTFILRVSDKLDLYIDATGRLSQVAAHSAGSN
ncbi:MAG TPA: YceI family protein [Terriglobales bacterium]|jgi:polyisoprenoid-binding protein YceI|nr:YceI family protein [Terriglobales bacterium]